MRGRWLSDWKPMLGVLGVGLAAVGLLTGAAPVGKGVRQGLEVCGNVLIPSLFPFLALSLFVSTTKVGWMLSRPAGWLARRVYHAPQELGPALLMSMIGGYPAGARALSALSEEGTISDDTAAGALCFCVNSGPAFLVAVVGQGIFGSPWAGVFLFVCQLIAGMLTGWLLLGRNWAEKGGRGRKRNFRPFTLALVESVAGTGAGMLNICAFVLLCSGFSSLLAARGVTPFLGGLVRNFTGGFISQQGGETLLAGALEICGGCAMAGGLDRRQAALVLPFLLSFGGLSVICQVSACFSGGLEKPGLFLRSRLIHGLLTQLLAGPPLYLLARTVPAGLILSPTLGGDSRTVPGTVCLLAMCAILLLTLESGTGGNQSKRQAGNK